MSTENENPVVVQDDLDLFSADFFGQNESTPEPASSEETEEADLDENDAPNEDTHGDEADDLDVDEDEGEPEAEEEVAPAPKKKNRFQERIDDLVGKQRESERQLAEALRQLEDLKQNKPEPTPAPTAVEENTGPTVNDLNEDGTDKYPLGEFDPGYIRDLTRFTIQQEREAIKAQDERDEAQRQQDAQRAELQSGWNEKLGPAKERYPDFQEKGEQLLDTFSSIDQAYGEYLSAVLMSIDHGPDVLYYLANNPDEAAKIVNSGSTRATLALGAINARFAEAEQEKQSARPRVSKAPTPPPQNKGSAAALPEVPDDTDDLEAFNRKLFPNARKRA